MKFCVIGIGRLGLHVATKLTENGMEVLAVDSSEAIISAIKDKVTQAVTMEVTDEESLRAIGVDEIETVIVAMGENFAQSILITALLKQSLNVPTVITRSISKIHRDILQLIGADHIILPEKEVGEQLADQLSMPFRPLVAISPNFSISQLEPPLSFVGKKIKELEKKELYDARIIGQKIQTDIVYIGPDHIVTPQDILILSGTNQTLSRIAKL